MEKRRKEVVANNLSIFFDKKLLAKGVKSVQATNPISAGDAQCLDGFCTDGVCGVVDGKVACVCNNGYVKHDDGLCIQTSMLYPLIVILFVRERNTHLLHLYIHTNFASFFRISREFEKEYIFGLILFNMVALLSKKPLHK